MQILKTPKIILSKTPKDFHIKAKCICGCKCLLEDAFDISYISGFKNNESVLWKMVEDNLPLPIHARPEVMEGYR